ncbi:MAG: DegT/DnrJ/EryC1/StrS family aminotransferase [Candidatus Methanomethylicaceae archaeon]
MIRLTIPTIEEDDLQAVCEALASGYLVQGPRVAAFEQAVADYVGVQHAVAVSNCTAALHLSLLALDTQPGDLVIVTAYSFIATANVIELCGAQPVFVDIQPDTFNMDPNRLEDVLKRLMSVRETARRVKAILPVHTFGQVADMPAILELANRYELPVIEDAACALGATLHGRQAGTWGVMGCFSFHPRKAITTGEGGMVVTNDAGLARRLRALRNHGQDPESSLPDFIMPGFNYRMTEFQAALGLTQMAKLDRIIAVRRRLAKHYDDLLKDTPLQIPVVAPGSQPVYQSYVVLLPERAAAYRSVIITHLKEQGIETTIGTWHMPLTTYFRRRYGYRSGDFPVAEQVSARSLTLPLYEALSSQEQCRIAASLLQIIY